MEEVQATAIAAVTASERAKDMAHPEWGIPIGYCWISAHAVGCGVDGMCALVGHSARKRTLERVATEGYGPVLKV